MEEYRFFVFGAPKSGTTWLQRVLNAHPSIACSGEAHLIESLATPMHAALLAYRDRMRAIAKLVYDDQPTYPDITDADINKLIKDSVESILLRAPKASSSLWVGDKTPAYAKQIRGLNLLYPDAKLFHIVRDPRDTATSTLNYAHRIDSIAGSSGQKRSREELINTAIILWRSTVNEVKLHSKYLRDRLLELRYEDLHFAFKDTFERIVSHLGLESDPKLTAKIEQLTSFQVASGGRKSGRAAPGEFHYCGTVGRFARDLSGFEIAMIEDQLGPMMLEYGYQPFQPLQRATG